MPDNPSPKVLRDDVLNLGPNRLRIIVGEVRVGRRSRAKVVDVGDHCQRVPMIILLRNQRQDIMVVNCSAGRGMPRLPHLPWPTDALCWVRRENASGPLMAVERKSESKFSGGYTSG